MKIQLFFIQLLLLSSFISLISAEQEEILIGETKIINFYRPQNGDNVDEEVLAGSFYFSIDQKIPEEDIAILVLGRRDFTHSPSLYVSNVVEQPSYDSYLNGEDTIACGIFGVDICVLPESQIQEQQKYFLGVYCLESCSFEIKVKYEVVKSLNMDEFINLNFAEKEQLKEVKLHIPTDFDKDHILVEALLLNPQEIEEPFQLLAKKGDTSIGDEDTYITAKDIWLNGQGFRLNKSDNLGLIYTLQIQAQPGSIIQIRSEAYTQKRILNFEKIMVDIVNHGGVEFYELTIPQQLNFKEQELDLSFDITPFTGVVELYVDYNYNIPSQYIDLDSYRWSITDSLVQSSLTISHREIEQNDDNDTKFLIAVKGKTAASFKLLGYTSNLNNRALVFDCTENGYLEGGEIEQYQLLLTGLTQQKINLSLTSKQGNVDLYLKICKNELNENNCQITEQDIINRDSLLEENKFYYSAENSLLDIIDFEYIPEDCQQINGVLNNACVFNVAVHSPPQKEGEKISRSHYKLIAKHQNSFIKLMENVEVHDSVQQGFTQYYKLNVQKDETIQKVIFHVSAISGEMKLYMNRDDNNPIPTSDNNERIGFSEIENLTFTLDKDGPLDTNYYMSITGFTACYYNILVKIYRKEKDTGEVSSSKQRIHYGATVKGYLYYQETETFWFLPDRRYEERKKTQVFLYYHEYDKSSKLEKSYSNAYPKVKAYFVDTETKTRKEMQVDSAFRNFQFVYLEFETNEEQIGHYEMELIHDQKSFSNIMFDFSFSINSDDVWRIIPEYGYVSELEDEDKSANYEMYLSSPQQVYVELFECFGKVHLEAASSYEKFESGQYDNPLKIPEFKGDHNIIPFDITEKGGFYFKVTSTSSYFVEGDPRTLFFMLPHTLPLGAPMPHNIFYIPQEGPYMEHELLVNYLDMESRSAQVSFKKIRCINDCIGVDYIIEDFMYILHITNKQDYLQFFAKCDLGVSDLDYFDIPSDNDLYYKKVVQEYKKQDYKTDIIQFPLTNLPEEELFIEMMGVVFIKTSENSISQPYTFIYEANTIHFEKQEEYLEHIKQKEEEEQQKNDTENQNNNNNNNNQDNNQNNNTQPDVTDKNDDQVNIEDPNYDPKANETHKRQKGIWKELQPIFFMLIGGALGVSILGFYCYKKRQGGLLPQSFQEQQDEKELEDL